MMEKHTDDSFFDMFDCEPMTLRLWSNNMCTHTGGFIVATSGSTRHQNWTLLFISAYLYDKKVANFWTIYAYFAFEFYF